PSARFVCDAHGMRSGSACRRLPFQQGLRRERFCKPRHGTFRRVEGFIRRGVDQARVVLDGRPCTRILDIAPKLLEAIAAIRSREEIDTPVVAAVLNAYEHDP